ncbi:MAG: adenylate/guanylate cyclase domain-containing protein [Aquaticitalea sp.]
MCCNKIAYYFLIGFFLLFTFRAEGQDQNVADRLVMVYQADTLEGPAQLELLRELSFNEVNDYQLGLQYAEELIDLAEEAQDYPYLSQGYFQKGSSHRLLGNLEDALEAFFKGAEIAKKHKRIPLEGSAYAAIADIYTISGNHSNAMHYYDKAIATLRKKEDAKIALATTILNAGDALLTVKSYDSALVYFEESGRLFEEENYLTGKAYNLGNIGMVYANTGKNELAETHINEAIRILEASEDYYPISVYLMSMGAIYLEKGEWQSAIDYTKRSLTIAQQMGLKEQMRDANQKLSELYEHSGDTMRSYKHYKDYIVFRDSLVNLDNVQQMGNLRTNYEVSQIDQRRKNQRNLAIAAAIGLLLIAILAIVLYRRNNFIRKTNKIIEEERDHSDRLLLNILPEETAAELKLNGSVKAKKYESVTVLFTDFIGFTNYSENLSPEALVETVSFYFSKFDTIVEKHGLEKIKTIGDAYMCAGGLHCKTDDHAKRMILAATEIISFVDETKKDASARELTFDIRIGINTGPVVAGIVGTKKFAYDIWGDTVNVAARMETMSESGRINISDNTYNIVKDDFVCEYRGEIEVKNRGALKMYFVN